HAFVRFGIGDCGAAAACRIYGVVAVLARSATKENMNRRSFIQATAGIAAATMAAPHVAASSKKSHRKRIAMIVTEVRKMSHGQHFLDRLLGGYGWQGAHHHPEVDLVSLYVDQFPENDLSREREKRFGCRIYPTVEE